MTPSSTVRPLVHVGLAATMSVLALAGCSASPTPAVMAMGDARHLAVTDGALDPADPAPDPAASTDPAASADPNAPSAAPSADAASPSPASPGPEATATPAPTPTPAPVATPTPAPVRVPNTKPIFNIAGMNSNAAWQPTNRSCFMDVTPDGTKVGIIWLNNSDASGAFATTGEPTAYATIGDPAVPGSFTTPQVVGKRPFNYASDATDSYKKFNSAHNAPYILATQLNGFLGFSVPMNANGYAQKMTPIPTGFGYQESEVVPGGSSWGNPTLSKLAAWTQGSSLSEMSGDMDPDGTVHLWGQGHLGQFQGGFGYQRRRSGETAFTGATLAAAYRPTGMNYFAEGTGYASKIRNSSGKYDLHAAISYNRQGDAPVYGLYYLKSRDGGVTWQNVKGQTVTLPLQYGANDASAAIVRAGLTTGGKYSGDLVGASQEIVGAADNGQPFIIRPIFTDSTLTTVQNWLYTYTGGRWIRVTVGPKLFWNAYGAGVSYNARTGNVNVVLLDTGNYAQPARVLLYSQPLSSLNTVSYTWKQEVVASVKQQHYASTMQVREVKDSKFVVLFESEYKNPGRVQPVLVETPMR